MDDEKLIELVRENTVLHDPCHPKHVDPRYKMSVWNSIGAEMNMTGIQCKSRWTNIRDHFRRHMQKRMSGLSDNNKRYKYEELLQFLMPHSREREPLTGAPPPADKEESSCPGEEPQEREEAPSPSTTARSFWGRQVRTEHPPPMSMTHIPPQQQDPIDAFLTGIASSMKRLSPYNQHLAKGRIFEVVHELEAQELFSHYPPSEHSDRNE